MNLKEYIESGKLELYVLGGLSDAEAREVERFAREYPEISHELNKVQNTLEKYSESISVSPRPEVKQKLMAVIESESRVILFTPMLRIAMAASMALVVLLAGYVLYLNGKLTDLRQELASIQQERESLNNQVIAQRTSLENFQQFSTLLSDTNMVKVVLRGTALSPRASATVYWNTRSQEVYLDPTGLPGVASDQQFQLWAIIDGKPVDMGMVEPGKSIPALKMKNATAVQAFAITLEKKGGSPVPTLEAMYVLGSKG